MSLLAEAPVAMEPPQTERERLLGISRDGRRFNVLEVHSTRIGPGDSEFDWYLSVYPVSGFYASAARARERMAELARQGLWLDAATRARMDRGENVPLHQYGWEQER